MRERTSGARVSGARGLRHEGLQAQEASGADFRPALEREFHDVRVFYSVLAFILTEISFWRKFDTYEHRFTPK